MDVGNLCKTTMWRSRFWYLYWQSEFIIFDA